MAPRLNLVPVERTPDASGKDPTSRHRTATLTTGAKPGGRSSQLPGGQNSAKSKKLLSNELLTGALKHGVKAKPPGKKKHSLLGQTATKAGITQAPAASTTSKLTSAKHNNAAGQTSIEKQGFVSSVRGAMGAEPALRDVTGRVQQHSSASAGQRAPPSAYISSNRRASGPEVSNSIAARFSQQKSSRPAAAGTHPQPSCHPTSRTSPVCATERNETLVQPTSRPSDLQGLNPVYNASKSKPCSQSPRPPRAPLSNSNPEKHASASVAQTIPLPAYAPPAQPIEVSPVAVPPNRIGRLSVRPRASPASSNCKNVNLNSTPKTSAEPADPPFTKQHSAVTEASPVRTIRLPSLSGFARQHVVPHSTSAPGARNVSASHTGHVGCTTTASVAAVPEVSEEALRALGFAPSEKSKQADSAGGKTSETGRRAHVCDAVLMSAPSNTDGQQHRRRRFSSAARRFLEMPAEERQCFIEQAKQSATRHDVHSHQAGGPARRHSAPIQHSVMGPPSASYQPPSTTPVAAGYLPTSADASRGYRGKMSAPCGPADNGHSTLGSDLCSPEVAAQATMRAPVTPPSVIIHAQAADPSEYGGDDLNVDDYYDEEYGEDVENAEHAHTDVQENGADWGEEQAYGGTYHDWGPEWDEEEHNGLAWQQEDAMQEDTPWEHAGAVEAHDPVLYPDSGNASVAVGGAQTAMQTGVAFQPYITNQPVTSSAGYAHVNGITGHAAPRPAQQCAPAVDMDAELRMAEEYDDFEDDEFAEYWQNEATYAGADHSRGTPHTSNLPATQAYHAPPSHSSGAQLLAQTQPYQTVPSDNSVPFHHANPIVQSHPSSAPYGMMPEASDAHEVALVDTVQQHPVQASSHALLTATASVPSSMQKRMEQQKLMLRNMHQHTHAPAHRDDSAPAVNGAQAARHTAAASTSGHDAAPQGTVVNAFTALRQGQLNLHGSKQGYASNTGHGAAHTGSTSRAANQVGSARIQVREILPGAPLIPRAVLCAYDARSTVPLVYARTGPPPEGLGKTGQPWWTVMQDFVPYALVKDGTDPRTGNCVYADYASQFAEIPASELAENQGSKPTSKNKRATDVHTERTAAVLGIGGGTSTGAAADGKRKSRPSSPAAKSGGKGKGASGKNSKKRKTQGFAELQDMTDGNEVGGTSMNLFCDDDAFDEGRPRTGTAKSSGPSRGAAMVERSLASKRKKSIFAGLSAKS